MFSENSEARMDLSQSSQKAESNGWSRFGIDPLLLVQCQFDYTNNASATRKSLDDE